MRPFNTLILAAGKGTRLSPLTDRQPKPLINLGDKPMLKRVYDQVKKVGSVKVFINAFHLGEQIVEWGRLQGQDCIIHLETELLGTGTPLYNAFLEDPNCDLLVLNGDILQNFDLEKFISDSQKSQSDISLLCREHKAVNTVLFENDKLVGIKNRFGETEAKYTATFTGISYYKKTALKEIKSDCFDIREFWKFKLLQKHSIGVFKQDKQDLIWMDMGTPEGFYQSHQWLLKNEKDFSMIKSAQNNIIAKSMKNNEVKEIDQLAQNSIFLSEIESLDKLKSQINKEACQIVGKDFVWTL